MRCKNCESTAAEMFHNLFEEEADSADYFKTGVQNNSLTKKMTDSKRPSSPRTQYDLCGLDNQGATCYLNSLLQTLNFTPEFRDALLNVPHEELTIPKNRVIPLELQKLFTRLLLTNIRAIQTTELTNSFGWTGVEELEQHDVQELNRILFGAIENSLKGTSGENIIRSLYCGTIVNRIKCLNCKSLSEKAEDFQDLTVIVSSMKSLENSLKSNYLVTERMCEKNQYFCSSCTTKVDAEKETRISSLPPILTFSLMRFSYNFEKRERYKETEHFSFPLELNMEKYCSKISDPEKFLYELFSVVIHNGSGYGGHYHVYIRDIDQLGKWIAPPSATKSPEKKQPKPAPVPIVTKEIDKNNPLQILIDIIQENTCVNLHNLGFELSKNVGSSWKSLYRKEHGPIAKFLLKNSDVFSINDATSIVTLKKPYQKETIPSVPQTELPEHQETTSELQEWFDFNDMHVTPVSIQDIKKQFSGNESAYMLFYRHKLLQRPGEARNNSSYGVPSHLLDLIANENTTNINERDAYDDLINIINVQVGFGKHHQFVDGVLQPIPDTLSVVLVPIDQRKTLQHLRDQIYELASDLCSAPKFSLHLAKELPAGLHLFKEFGLDIVSKTLTELEIRDNDYLFVSYGNQLFEVPIGEDFAPVLLNVTCLLENQEKRITRAFPKNILVAEVKIFLTEVTNLSLPLTLKVDAKDKTKAEMNDDSTLGSYELVDGDSLLAHDLKLDKDSVCVKVYNKFQMSNNVKDNCCSSIEMIVSKNVKILDLKIEIMLKFSLDISHHSFCRLRKLTNDNSASRVPLYEEDVIDNILKKGEKELVLEDGQSPSADEILLYYKTGSIKDEAPPHEIIISKMKTIQECMRQMIHQASLDESLDWNIGKPNHWLEDIEPIKEVKQTLDEAGLQNGDIAILQEKKIPIIVNAPLKFFLRLYPTPEILQSDVFRIEENESRKQCAKMIQSSISKVFENLSSSSEEYLSLGSVELPDNSLLSDLKMQILTLPLLVNVPLPNYRFLRLRHYTNNKLGVLIRNHSQSLKQLKLTNEGVLSVQVLTSEEELKPSEVLLSVAQRIPDTQTYLPANDIIWDGEKNFYLKSLQSCVSEILNIPVHKLLMAKHNPKEFKWQILSDFFHGKKSNKKKGKINLRQAPYHLKDGDMIGVKNKDFDLDREDFSTEDDKIGILQKAQFGSIPQSCVDDDFRISEPRMRGGALNSPNKISYNLEVGIKIHVDDFT